MTIGEFISETIKRNGICVDSLRRSYLQGCGTSGGGCFVLPEGMEVPSGHVVGPTFVFSTDPTGMQRCERIDVYKKRVESERTVRFMCGEESLKEVTMKRYRELTGEKACH